MGCSLYSDTDGGAAVHFDLRQGEGGGGGGGGGDGAALLEAAWLAVAKLLCGEAQAVLVVPNVQLVLRTLLLVLPELRPAATLEGLLCDAGALDVSRWVDPVVVAWLCEPDLPEEQQRLAALYAKHLPAAAAEVATRAAEKDGEAQLHRNRMHTARAPRAHRMHRACTPHAQRMHNCPAR